MNDNNSNEGTKQKVLQWRRKINDSRIGQKINSSLFGILFEGSARAVNELFKGVHDEYDAQTHYAHSSCLYSLEKVKFDGRKIRDVPRKYMARIPFKTALAKKIKEIRGLDNAVEEIWNSDIKRFAAHPDFIIYPQGNVKMRMPFEDALYPNVNRTFAEGCFKDKIQMTKDINEAREYEAVTQAEDQEFWVIRNKKEGPVHRVRDRSLFRIKGLEPTLDFVFGPEDKTDTVERDERSYFRGPEYLHPLNNPFSGIS
jgi:hypothetical protein